MWSPGPLLDRRRLTFPSAEYDYTLIGADGPHPPGRCVRRPLRHRDQWTDRRSESSFGADMDAPPAVAFAVNVFLRDGDTVYRTWHTNGRGTEQLSHSFALIDTLPWGRQE